MSVAVSSAGATSMSATGSPPTVRRLKSETRAPIRSSTLRRPVRVGLIPIPCRRRSEPERSVAATMYGAAEEKSPGTSRSSGLSRSAGQTEIARAASARRGRRPPRAAARCGRGSGFGSTTTVGPSRRLEPGEEDGRLHLGARDRQLVADRVEAVAGDHDRRVAVGRLDVRAHLAQRLGDALERAAWRATRPR